MNGTHEFENARRLRDEGEIKGIVFWKLPIKDILFFVKCTNFVPFVANLEEDESYFSIREGCFLSSIHTIEDNRSFPSLYHSGSSNMAERGDLEKSGEGIKEKGEILGCVPAPMSELREPANSMGGEPPVLPPTPDNEGRSMLRRTPGVVLR